MGHKLQNGKENQEKLAEQIEEDIESGRMRITKYGKTKAEYGDRLSSEQWDSSTRGMAFPA